MAQYGEAARNAMLDSLETTLGTAAKLRVYSGTAPANAGTAASGTLLLEYTLATDWAANAASGSKALTGTPLTTTALAAGTAGYYRFVNNAGTVVSVQGPASATGGGGELTFDNATFTVGQTVNVTAYSFTIGGA